MVGGSGRREAGLAVVEPPSAAEAMELADGLAGASAGALRAALDAVIVHGSLALGDYLPGTSDVDLLAIVDGPLDDRQVAVWADAVEQVGGSTAVRVDLRSITRGHAAAPVGLPEMETYVKIGARPRAPVRVEGRREKERDLIVELSVCRARGRSILGPPPAELIGPVAKEWVLSAGDAQLADWQAIGDDPPYAQLTVLTACRVWRFAEEGRHCSKEAAAEWALRQDPAPGVVRNALAQRHAGASRTIDPAAVQELLSRVRGRVARSTRR